MTQLRTRLFIALVATALAGCSSDNGNSTTPITFARNPCSRADTVTLATAATALVDCSTGGTTVTLAGGGANYLVIPQFATSNASTAPVTYTLASGTVVPSSIVAATPSARRSASVLAGTGLPTAIPGRLQRQFDERMLSQAASSPRSTRRAAPDLMSTPPALGSTRNFSVESGATTIAFKTVTATLAYIGSNIYLYIDNNAPANGFTGTQLNNFGLLFDQTLYPIAVNAFGGPSDVDGNGHVIMLMSPVVNSLSPSAQCATNGYVAGFFESGDLDGSLGSNSNSGEIFYSIVPDSAGTVSCKHTVADVGAGVPATFLHELQHLINFSQHAILHAGAPGSSWLDEGMSISAEELGSLYYEQKCPPPACRTSPAQIFPDSSQGFAASFLYDSYQYALLPDSASITLHNDSQDGFSWRGGNWLLVHYLADLYGTHVYQQLETGPSDGIADIAAASGQPFTTVFGNFGIALYADSFPGLPRTTAQPANRFATRNLRQIWARLFATSSGNGIPLEMPLTLSTITNIASPFSLVPGTMTYWRLNTSASDGPVTIRFGSATGAAFASSLHPQLAIMRLPPGQ